MRKPLVVYHKISDTLDCSDGFAAAFVFWLKFGDEYEYAPAMYYRCHELSLFEGRKVYFVDFAYDDTEFMDAIAEAASSFRVFDHHKTAMLNLGTKPYAIIDMAKSGSQLAWEYVFPNDELPLLLYHIQDHDTGARIDPNTKAFIQHLRSLPADFDVWKQLLLDLQNPEKYAKFIEQGKVLEKSHLHHCEILSGSAFPIVLAGVEGLAVNSNRFFSHDVGRILADKCGTFGASFFFREDGDVEFSLTSSGTFDVEQVAFKYNGGGHAKAAGFSMSLPSFVSIVDLSNKKVLFYMGLQSNMDEFFSNYTAPSYHPDVSSDIGKDLGVYLKTKLGAVVDDLQIQVTTVRESQKSFKVWLMTSLAKFLDLPLKDTTPKWYHRVFPYSVKRISEFDDNQIQELLELSKSSDDTPDAREFVLNNLLQTVKYKYEASLIEPASYSAQVCVNFPNSSFFIRHSFST